MRLLFLTPQFPFPPTQGAAIRNSHLIRGLTARHEVTLLTFASRDMPPGSWRRGSLPERAGLPPLARLTLVPPPTRTTAARLATLLGSALPDMARRLASPALQDAVDRTLAAGPFDWLVVEGLEMAPYHRRGGRWLLDEHNAEYLLQQRTLLAELPRAGQPRAALGAAYSLVQWRRLRRYERAICRAASAVTAVSPADAAALRRLDPLVRPVVVPNGVDLAEWARAAVPSTPEVAALRAGGPLLVFDGSMDFRPNVDAVCWFCAACWPAVRARHPLATFAIVGRAPSATVRALGARPGVRVIGPVPDPRPWVAAADVYVLPMRMGGGVRLKLLQALALGCAVVTTALGAEGVDLAPGRDVVIAESGADFAAAITRLLDEPARRATLGAAARAAVVPYAWDTIVPRFEALLSAAGARDRGARAQPSPAGDAAPGAAASTDPLQVSLVLTVRNEAGSLGGLLQSLARQTRPPDELVIVDGGSADDTADRLRAAAAGLPFPVRLEIVPGANISRGRNAAIAAAQYPIIAVTDAGVRLPEGWLAALVAPFARPGGQEVDVVSGFFAPDPQTVFERAMGATVLPALEEVRPAQFLPSSRSFALRRSVWATAGGYPEWLDYCEDLVFDLALRAQGCRFVFAPAATVLFRPRRDLPAFWRQYYRYARGDGKADLWRKRHAVRYLTYLAAPLLAAAARRRPILWLALLAAGGAYCRAPYRRLGPWLAGLGRGDLARAVLLVPLIRLVGDLAKMAGYPAGVWWRRRPGRAAARREAGRGGRQPR